MDLQAVAVVGKQNNPLYIHSFSSAHQDLKYQYCCHTACDIIEERVNSSSKQMDLYLGLLHALEDLAVYGYMTNTKVKFIVVVGMSNAPVKDSEMKAIFAKIHNLYVELVCNPFWETDSKISSPHFRQVTRSHPHHLLQHARQDNQRPRSARTARESDKKYDGLILKLVRPNSAPVYGSQRLKDSSTQSQPPSISIISPSKDPFHHNQRDNHSPVAPNVVKTQTVRVNLDKYRIEQVALRRLRYIVDHNAALPEHITIVDLVEEGNVPPQLVQKFFGHPFKTAHDIRIILLQSIEKNTRATTPHQQNSRQSQSSKYTSDCSNHSSNLKGKLSSDVPRSAFNMNEALHPGGTKKAAGQSLYTATTPNDSPHMQHPRGYRTLSTAIQGITQEATGEALRWVAQSGRRATTPSDVLKVLRQAESQTKAGAIWTTPQTSTDDIYRKSSGSGQRMSVGQKPFLIRDSTTSLGGSSTQLYKSLLQAKKIYSQSIKTAPRSMQPRHTSKTKPQSTNTLSLEPAGINAISSATTTAVAGVLGAEEEDAEDFSILS